MFGLAVLAAFVAYCLITLILMWIAARMARLCGIKGWNWSLPVMVVMYFLVFEDHLPSIVLHDYYCSSDRAGFWAYKSIDEWKQENPGVWETLSPTALPEEYLVEVKTGALFSDRYYRLPDGTELKAHFKGDKFSSTDLSRSDIARGFWLNQRFSWLISKQHTWFHVYKLEDQIIDNQTDEVVARYVDYQSLVVPIAYAGLPFEVKSCEPERDQVNRKQFIDFRMLLTPKGMKGNE